MERDKREGGRVGGKEREYSNWKESDIHVNRYSIITCTCVLAHSYYSIPNLKTNTSSSCIHDLI